MQTRFTPFNVSIFLWNQRSRKSFNQETKQRDVVHHVNFILERKEWKSKEKWWDKMYPLFINNYYFCRLPLWEFSGQVIKNLTMSYFSFGFREMITLLIIAPHNSQLPFGLVAQLVSTLLASQRLGFQSHSGLNFQAFLLLQCNCKELEHWDFVWALRWTLRS